MNHLSEFRGTFEQVQPRVMAMLLRGWIGPNGQRVFIATRAEAEDICAEAWRVFYEHARTGRYELGRPAEPFVIEIARRMALSHVRKVYRRAQKVSDVRDPSEGDAGLDPRLDLVLDQAISELGEPMKTIFQAKTDGRSEREVGQLLGLSRDQVRRRYVVGLRQVREYFRAQGFVEDTPDLKEAMS